MKASPCLASWLVYYLGEVPVSFFPSGFAGSCFTSLTVGSTERVLSVSSFLCFPLCSAEQGITYSVLLLVHYDITFNFFFSTSACAQPSSYSASFFFHWWKKHIITPGFILQEVRRAHNACCPVWNLIKRDRPGRGWFHLWHAYNRDEQIHKQWTTSKSTCLQVEAAVPQWDMH